jgi:hypothetical protein
MGDNLMGPKGQILSESSFGDFIGSLIGEYKPNKIVEIGTWKGLGSTLVIINSIKKYLESAKFYSLESNKVFYEEAVCNLQENIEYVELIYGRIIEKYEIDDFVKNEILTDEQSLWLIEDLQNFAQCNNVLDRIPDQIDFLLLDGGEFSTYAEWSKLKARTEIVALDDTHCLKCKKIRCELIEDDSYDMLIDSDDRNGFSVFKKKK